LDESLKDLNDFLLSNYSEDIISSNIEHDHLSICIVFSSIESITSILKLNNICKFRTLIDITAIDFPSEEKRFTLVYHYLSMQQNIRIRLKSSIKEGQIVPSITKLFPAANWFEREVFDMYGILFSNHPDMRRILTDYGFQGHPLRKDFPTTGYLELRYDQERKKVVYEPVKLTQEYRRFDFMSPWEGEGFVFEQSDEVQEENKENG
jgi:NADH-quinone oxidoreductase subunit C|tara:strand:- start:2760 stop:3380 length:621 start_codon:yes stop_codon:yes gene_type:complete